MVHFDAKHWVISENIPYFHEFQHQITKFRALVSHIIQTVLTSKVKHIAARFTRNYKIWMKVGGFPTFSLNI